MYNNSAMLQLESIDGELRALDRLTPSPSMGEECVQESNHDLKSHRGTVSMESLLSPTVSEIIVDDVARPHSVYPHAVRFGDMLFFSGVGPREADSVSVNPDFTNQCNQVFRNVSAMCLQALKSQRDAHENIQAREIEFLSIEVFLTDRENREKFETLFCKHFPGQHLPSILTVNALPGEIPIQVEMKIVGRYLFDDIQLETAHQSLDVSGYTASAYSTSLPIMPVSALDDRDSYDLSDDPLTQFGQVFDKFEEKLHRLGAKLENVIDVEVRLKNLRELWPIYNDFYKGRFNIPRSIGSVRPARTTIGVSRMKPDNALIQIKAMVAMPS